MAMLNSQDANLVAADPVKDLVRKPPEDGTVEAVANVGIYPGIAADQLDCLGHGPGKVIAQGG